MRNVPQGTGPRMQSCTDPAQWLSDMTMDRRILSEGQSEPAEGRGRYRKDLARYVKER